MAVRDVVCLEGLSAHVRGLDNVALRWKKLLDTTKDAEN